jgi:hypothetical protein
MSDRNTVPEWVDINNAGLSPGDILEGRTDDLLAAGATAEGGNGVDWNLISMDVEKGRAGIVIAGGICGETDIHEVLGAAADGSVVLAPVKPENFTANQKASLGKLYGETPSAAAEKKHFVPDLWISDRERSETRCFAPTDDPTR